MTIDPKTLNNRLVSENRILAYVPTEHIRLIDEASPDLLFTDELFLILKRSIRFNGILVPILLSSDLRIIDGRKRHQAALALRYTSVPALILPDMSDRRKELAGIATNLTRRTLRRDQREALALRSKQLSLAA